MVCAAVALVTGMGYYGAKNVWNLWAGSKSSQQELQEMDLEDDSPYPLVI